MKTKIKTKKTIQNKLIVSFILVEVIILFLMWILEVALFGMIYRENKKSELTTSLNIAVKIYNLPSYEVGLAELSNNKDVSITIFKMTSDTTTDVVYSSARDAVAAQKRINQFLSTIGDGEELYFTDGYGAEVHFLTFAKKTLFQEGEVYFMATTSLVPVHGFVDVVTKLLIIMSLSSLITAIVVATILSKRISVPLSQISDRAQEISSGNLAVKFDSKGYEEVEQISRTLNYAIEEIKKSDEIRKDVVANVSHELKTPLTMIKSYTELIQDISGDNKEKREQHLQIISEQVDKLNMLVNDMIDLSKMQSNTIQYDKTEFDLSELVTKVIAYYTEKFKSQGYSFEFDCCKNAIILADKLRIEQVITNLINNAVNYSIDDKKIKIELFEQTIEGKKKYLFKVIDNGMGIKQEDQDKIFDRHFRSVAARKATTGSGIGLSIVKQILNYHQFKFGVESEVDKGSTFFVVFEW